MADLLAEFTQPEGLRYLNHAAVAPWPHGAARAVAEFENQNATIGARDYPDWLKIEHRLRQRLSRLLKTPGTVDIALVKNTSEGLSFIAFGLDWRAGDQVVISDEEFPSNRVVWQALERHGVEVLQVSLSGANPEADLLAACGPRTRLLSISSVQYASGLVLDLPRLGEGCEARGVLFCVDAIQHLGALPFDVKEARCAFVVADGHKWMLGPEGLGVFYCRSDLREQLTLHEYGWHMLEHAGDYLRQDWKPARSARRFECGSPNMLASMALEASLSLLEEIGMPQVTSQLSERMEYLQHGLQSIPGVTIHSPRNTSRRAGILNFTLDGWEQDTLFETLRQQQIVCAQRGAGIRFSPHFYTTGQVLDETLAVISQLANR